VTDSLRGRLVSDSLWYAVGKALPAVAGVAVVLVASRVFDTAEFGRYSLVLATSVLLGSIGYGWLRQSILRYLPRYQGAPTIAARLGEMHALSLATTVAVGLGALPILLSQGYSVPLVAVGSLLTLAFVGFRHVGTLLQADLESRRYVAVTSLQAVIQLLLLALLLIPGLRTVESLIILTAVSYLLATVLALRMTRAEVLRLRVRWPAWEVTRSYLAYGLPMAGWFFMSQVLNVGDQYVIQWARGADELGIYSAGYTIANKTFAVLTMPVLLAMHPLIMKVWEETRSQAETGELLSGAAKLYSIGTLPLIAYFVVASDVIVRVALGQEFWAGAAVMWIVSVGFWFSGIAQYAHKGLELVHRTGTMLAAATVAAVVNIALNIVAVPHYGYMAAAYTTVAAMGLYLLIVRHLARRHLRWAFPWSAGVRVALSAAMATIPTVLLLQNIAGLPALLELIVSLGVYAAAYVGLLVMMRVVRHDQLGSLLRRIREREGGADRPREGFRS
jgi:O-antigen/teichoic acid export membrane protein